MKMAYENLTVAELKELLRERGLPVSGKKADLIARLNDGDDSTAATPEEAPQVETQEETPEMEISAQEHQTKCKVL